MFGLDPIPSVVVLAAIIAVLLSIAKRIIPSGMMLCPNCLTQASPKSLVKGSIFIEIVLWICFIIPGIIYSIWRMTTRSKVCPACRQPGMIPLDTPRARQLLAK